LIVKSRPVETGDKFDRRLLIEPQRMHTHNECKRASSAATPIYCEEIFMQNVRIVAIETEIAAPGRKLQAQ